LPLRATYVISLGSTFARRYYYGTSLLNKLLLGMGLMRHINIPRLNIWTMGMIIIISSSFSGVDEEKQWVRALWGFNSRKRHGSGFGDTSNFVVEEEAGWRNSRACAEILGYASLMLPYSCSHTSFKLVDL
jgi:hypothetical protein